MSFYPTELKGKGCLRSGFKVKYSNLDKSHEVMKPCYGFDSKDLCEKFCELLFQEFEKIYNRYPQPELKKGDKVWWISTYSQSHLNELVIPEPDYCKDPKSYENFYTFNDDNDCKTALHEMQNFANKLYEQLQ